MRPVDASAPRDIARIEVMRFERPSPLGNANLDSLVLIMRDGREAGLVVPGDVEEVREMMRSRTSPVR
jgi:hypothetical protein